MFPKQLSWQTDAQRAEVWRTTNAVEAICDRFGHCHLTLNIIISARFCSAVQVHGSIVDDSVPNRDNTERNVDHAVSVARNRLAPSGTVSEVVFLGVSLTNRNGRGLPRILELLVNSETRYIVVDTDPKQRQRLWLRNNIVGLQETHVELVKKDAYGHLLETSGMSQGELEAGMPSVAELNDTFEALSPPRSDGWAVDVWRKVVVENRLQFPAGRATRSTTSKQCRPRSSQGSKKPPKQADEQSSNQIMQA